MSSQQDSCYYNGDSSPSNHRRVLSKQKERELFTESASGVVLALVGLPARGKSFISRKLERFLLWKGLATRTVNVGKFRREIQTVEVSGRSNFFDCSNDEAKAAREAAFEAAIDDALSFLADGGQVAILDATNSTRERRARLKDIVAGRLPTAGVVFLEILCNDEEVLEANMENKVRFSPDFAGLSFSDALEDLRARIANYERVYETVQDDEGASIKLIDLSSKVIAHACYGRIARNMVPFLMSIHIGARPIWITRPAITQAVLQGGGSSGTATDCSAVLTEQGKVFSSFLSETIQQRATSFWEKSNRRPEPTYVLTSTLPRAIATALQLPSSCFQERWSGLNPIDKGTMGTDWWDVECEGGLPPWSELKARRPDFFEEFSSDPWNTRFPGGESYRDLQARMEAALLDAEMCTRPVLIVTHITVLQILYAYFKNIPVQNAWQIRVPCEVVLELTPTLGGGYQMSEYKFD